MSYKNLKDMKDQIEFDVAWLSFDEGNKFNDTTKVIDLNCLEVKDALVITFSKIHAVALKVHEEYVKNCINISFAHRIMNKNNSVVLQILCGNNQIYSYTDFIESRGQMAGTNPESAIKLQSQFSKNLSNAKNLSKLNS